MYPAVNTLSYLSMYLRSSQDHHEFCEFRPFSLLNSHPDIYPWKMGGQLYDEEGNHCVSRQRSGDINW